MNAVKAFCQTIVQQGLRDRFYRLNLFCGDGLTAALVPLYRGQSRTGTQLGGTTDTNINFVSDNYVETGATGGLTASANNRYLNTGLAPSALPSVLTGHMSYYRSTGSQGGSFTYLTMGATDAVPYRMDERSSGQFGFWGSFGSLNNAVANAGGQRIVSRNGPTSITLYSNGTSVATNATSTTPTSHSRNWFVFTSNDAGSPNASYFLGTLRSYSIGAELTAAQASSFNTAMQAFQTSLFRDRASSDPAFSAVTNAEAKLWIDNVYANGGSVSTATANAVNTFCNDIESAGIRDRFYRLNLFAGTGLSAALVPLYRGPSLGGTQFGGTTDTNNNFVSGDYVETGATGGLLGNGSTKRLATGFDPVTTGMVNTDTHISWYSRAAITANNAVVGAFGGGAPGATWQVLAFGGISQLYYRSGGATNSGIEAATWSGADRSGHVIAMRNGSDAKAYRQGTDLNLTVTVSNVNTWASVSPGSLFVFARNNVGTADQFLTATLQGYSLGLSMSGSQASAFSTAMQTFQTSLGRQL
jgi:hypothetical protein